MTERPLSITTQIATPIQATFNSAASISANDALAVTESVDEEPYTIKCICDYSDDDGNTIYCETCDTWQHIECFYPGRVDDASREEFDHSCADCKPRPLDKRHATERQRHQRQNKAINDPGDKKTKRPPSKSHKKKSKPSELQVNGFHEHDGHKNGSPHESHHSHSKKAKGHRSTQSINSQIKRSPPYSARPNTHTHPPSPAHTPPDLPNNFDIHSYSELFLSLYNDDENVQRTSTNSFANLSVTNSMASWLHDPASLYKDTGIRDRDEVFQYLKNPIDLDQLKWPDLIVERKDSIVNDRTVSKRSLVTSVSLSQTGRITELTGVVGFQKDYSDDLESRWADTVHPRPFIFFHPRLPLFIDTRLEGSICRYVRRSCRANTALETFIANGHEYHFWLVSERPLAANEQITIPWDFRFPSDLRSRYLHLLNLGDEDGTPFDGTGINAIEYEQLTDIINHVLSDHGGCACELDKDCAFTRFHRNYYHGRSQSHSNGSNGVKPKKGRKPKQIHVSPTSTGHATNSRAPSEGQPEPCDEDDTRSVSGSSRSKPHSRDLTPSNGVGESNGILTEPSDREKRKLAMLEDSFRKMEQREPPRKKKRASDGPATNPATNSTPQQNSKPRQKSIARMSISQPQGLSLPVKGGKPQYVDASTSRRQSGSPFSTASPTAALPSPENPASSAVSVLGKSRPASTTPRGPYVDACTQTDDVEHAWWKEPRAKGKKTIVPLAKRLLRNRQMIEARQSQQEAQNKEQSQAAALNGGEVQSVDASSVVPMDLDVPVQEDRSLPESPTDSKGRNASIASSTPSVEISSTQVDINMTDVPAIMISNTIKPSPPPWPNHSNNVAGSVPAQRSPDLRVQMPPTPTFTSPNTSGPLSASLTPSSATGSMAQSPFGTMQFPNTFPSPVVNGIGQHATASPVKTKKMSLSEYKAARLSRNDSANANKSVGGSSPTTDLAVLKPSLSTIEEAKAPGVMEGSTVVDSPALENTSDSLISAPLPASDVVSKNNTSADLTNGTL